MSTSPALSIVATKKVIDVSWWAMLRVCEGAFYREIHDLVEAEETAERQHRRARRDRFPISVNYAARMFAVQHVCEAPTGLVKWSDVATYAPRIIAAYGLGARMRETKIHGRPTIFAGETYFPRMISTITQAIAEGISDKDYQLLHARRAPNGIADHLPLVCALDYPSDIVRGK